MMALAGTAPSPPRNPKPNPHPLSASCHTSSARCWRGARLAVTFPPLPRAGKEINATIHSRLLTGARQRHASACRGRDSPPAPPPARTCGSKAPSSAAERGNGRKGRSTRPFPQPSRPLRRLSCAARLPRSQPETHTNRGAHAASMPRLPGVPAPSEPRSRPQLALRPVKKAVCFQGSSHRCAEP
jgi:hypothetical protein